MPGHRAPALRPVWPASIPPGRQIYPCSTYITYLDAFRRWNYLAIPAWVWPSPGRSWSRTAADRHGSRAGAARPLLARRAEAERVGGGIGEDRTAPALRRQAD